MAGPASICSANESYSQSDLRPGDRAGTITQCGPDPVQSATANLLAAQVITELDQRRGGRADRPHRGHPFRRDRRVRYPQTHHTAGLGHIDSHDPLDDLSSSSTCTSTGCCIAVTSASSLGSLGRGCPRGPVGLAESDRRARSNSAQPFEGPRRQTERRPHVPARKRRRAGSPAPSFPAHAAAPKGTWRLSADSGRYTARTPSLPTTATSSGSLTGAIPASHPNCAKISSITAIRFRGLPP